MKRGAPLKRTAWMRAKSTTPRTDHGREQRIETRALAAMTNVVARPANTGPSTTPLRTAPKAIAHRNSHLLKMAKGKPCLLCVPGVCTQDRATVVCCHSNSSTHGKAGARRADDHYSVWGCFACHSWLDQGKAPAAAKASTFMRAHLVQVLEWRAIAFDTRSAPKDRAAAQWALALLNATPTGEPL